MDTKNNLEARIKPWELDKSLVRIAAAFSSKVVEETNDGYKIEFYDYDCRVVGAELSKDKLSELPHPIGIGTNFWVIACYINEKLITSAWPVAKYWHKSWDEIDK